MVQTTGRGPSPGKSPRNVPLIKQAVANSVHYSAWIGHCRLAACTANVIMIIGVYFEYLWAADWPEIPSHCEYRSSLPWLEFANCFHRYTFSHAMLHGQNLAVYGLVSPFVAVCFIIVELKRVRRLRSLLQFHLVNISRAGEQDESQALSSDATYTSLGLLPIYSFFMILAFVAVLLLVPFHLERPRLHYATAAVAAGSMLAGVCTYSAIPLEQAAGFGRAGDTVWKGVSHELLNWAQRHQLLRNWSGIVISLHIVLPTAAAIHHFAWVDLSGRFFGAVEVLTIASYQVFVAYFASDDFDVQKNIQQAR